MMSGTHYQGILFPDRAESLPQFQGYKVFLDFWDPLAKDLRAFYEGLALRRETRCLAVFGAQGSGKTLFAHKLVGDFKAAQEAANAGRVKPDENNLWHRMTGGGSMDPALVARATLSTDILHIEDNPKWVEEARQL
jgi:hypothetical protein